MARMEEHEALDLYVVRSLPSMSQTSRSQKKLQIPTKVSFYFLLGGEKWVLVSRSQKNYKSNVKFIFIFYGAAKSTIKNPKKLQILPKISIYFLLGGENWVLPSRSQKNHKSHVKFLFISFF